jgi:hypothetical protein
MRRKKKYAAMTRDEGNAADGYFSSASGEAGCNCYIFSLRSL